ncbi:MAG: hypothetical protein U9R03_04865, partial [Candidatus Aerophobetes bacterium]|nr:hypothetical protein [Candidatus Aerophobetes bacterium]
MKVKKLVDNILDAEKASNIFKLKFKNYSIWPYYRMYFYYKYSKDLKILDESSSSMKFSIKYILKIIKIFNLYKLFKNKKYFILEHPRSNKEGKDIYTDDLVQSLGKDNCSFFTFTQGGISDKENSPIVLDFLKIFSKLNSKLFYKFTKNKYFKENFQSFLNTINADDKNTYFSHYKRYYIEFIIQFYFYYFILKVKKIEKVYLTVYYYNLALVVAAKKLNIETIEIQHGVVSK